MLAVFLLVWAWISYQWGKDLASKRSDPLKSDVLVFSLMYFLLGGVVILGSFVLVIGI